MVAVTMVLLIGSADAWGCPSGFKGCNKHKPGCETNIKTDADNCGKKCEPCPYTHVKCEQSACTYTCKAGRANCDRSLWSTGCETDIDKDAQNCGECRKSCKQVPNVSTNCSSGKCQEPMCKTGWGNCDGNIWSNGCEKDLSKNINNCGKCGHKRKVTLMGGEATRQHGQCGQQSEQGTKLDKHKNCCVPVY